MQQNNESHLVTVSQTSTGEISERLRAAGARVQQLEGELAGAREGLPMRDAEMRERGRREAETERDTLRAEVNRLNAEVGELKRKLDETQLAHETARSRLRQIHDAANCSPTQMEEALTDIGRLSLGFHAWIQDCADQPSEPKP